MNFEKLFHRTHGRNRDGRNLGRWKTRDAAFTFRMGAGFAGDCNRTRPFSIEACLIDTTYPPAAYGLGVLYDQAAPNGVRQIQTTDSAINAIAGVTVRPFPIQAPSATNFGQVALGAGNTPPTSGVIDILKEGYIIVPLGGSAAAYKGSPVYIYYGASTGTHVQGGFEAGSGSNLIELGGTTGPGTRIYFNGPADASGLVELAFEV